jgi:CheY-like chemotaxis protein
MSTQQSLPTATDQVIPSTEPSVILVVDDSAIDRQYVGAILERRPHWRSIFASTVDEGIAAIDQEMPDLVITDMLMPGRDGMELVEEISGHHPGLPVILMTGYGSEDLAVRALKTGAASYVPKKNLIHELIPTVERTLATVHLEHYEQRALSTLVQLESLFSLPCQPDLIPHLVKLVVDSITSLMQTNDPSFFMRFSIALEEVIQYMMVHGNLEIDPALRDEDAEAFERMVESRRRTPLYRTRQIRLHIKVSSGSLTVIVCHDGPGQEAFYWPDIKDESALQKSSQRGLLLARTTMDSILHSQSGNHVTMVKSGRTQAVSAQ